MHRDLCRTTRQPADTGWDPLTWYASRMRARTWSPRPVLYARRPESRLLCSAAGKPSSVSQHLPPRQGLPCSPVCWGLPPDERRGGGHNPII